MDKKQALAELIKGLKRVKSELEETLAKEVVPEETFSQKLRKKKDDLKKSDETIKPLKGVKKPAAVKTPAADAPLTPHEQKAVKKPGLVSKVKTALQLSHDSEESSKESSEGEASEKTEASQEVSKETSEKSEESKKDSKSRFKDMLFKMKEKK